MIQTITILTDSMRMLLERKLFWVSFIFSSLLGLIYLSISLEPDGLSLFFGMKHIENDVFFKGSADGEFFYVSLFSTYITRYWLGGGAILLALISTVSVFPEFMKPGTIEVSLSKPVSRMKLFFVKYFGCLIFAGLQASLFALIVFVAIGWRLEYWNWTIFWVVPIITFAFSLIHCVQVLVGVLTRSSLMALLSGISFWGLVWLVQMTEQTVYLNAHAMVEEKMSVDWKTGKFQGYDEKQKVDAEAQENYQLVKSIATPLPKVRDVTLYLDQLVQFRDSGSILEQVDLIASVEKNDIQFKAQRAERRTQERHTPTYIYLSSLGFECVVLSLACFIFVRRDY